MTRWPGKFWLTTYFGEVHTMRDDTKNIEGKPAKGKKANRRGSRKGRSRSAGQQRQAQAQSHTSGPGLHDDAPAVSASITVTMLPVGKLKPSGWNPNAMADKEYAAYREEVKRLGKLPKPIVVIPDGSRYEIVDGEHGWRAAKDNDFTEVPCEIVQVD